MSELYHALGDQGQLQPDPRSSSRLPYPQGGGIPPGQPPVGSGYDSHGPGQVPQDHNPRAGYQSAPVYGYARQQQPFSQPPAGYPAETPQHGPMGGLTTQMGGLGFKDVNAAASVRGTRKKHRHAHHDLDLISAALPSHNTAPYGGQGFPGAQTQPSPTQPYPGAAPLAPYTNNAGTSSYRPTVNEPFNPALPSPGVPTSIRAFGQGQGNAAHPYIDPDQIPSLPRTRDILAEYYFDHVYPTLENHPPPPAAVQFVARDQGNSSPKFARLTMNNIPSTAESLASTGVPLGLLLQPLAKVHEDEPPIPVLDFGEAGPPRCRRCRAYINPFMIFRSGGNRFVCNMCTFPNEVPNEYFSPVNPQGVRVDRDQRPELCRGTVEFMVPKEYWAKNPVGLRILFVIDVGQEAVNRAFLEGVCEGILGALYGGDETNEDEPGKQDDNGGNDEQGRRNAKKRSLPASAKVGIMTFDKQVHFYNLSPGTETPHMMVMPDIEDPFVPLSDGLFADPYESREVITSLLTQLPTLFSEIKHPEPALLPTLNAALSALSATGGKIVCSLSALPTWGPGRLFLRDDGKIHAGENERKLFTTEHPAWKKTAEKMVQSGIGVDFFLAAPSGGYLDIATVGHVSATTGGEVFYFPNFQSPRDVVKLSKELKHTVTRETGYQALMKVRCSNGLQVDAYHGNFVQHTFGAELELGIVDADKAFGITFSYDGKLDPRLDAHFQSALLYTTAAGERRVRCCNLVANVSEGGRGSMKFVDQDAIISLVAKEAASRVTERSLKEVRANMTEKTIDMFAGYRKNYSVPHPAAQLVLPEGLKEFGLYMLGLLKTRAFKGGHEPTDRRSHDIRMIKSMGATELSVYLYPRVIAIHNMSEKDGFTGENGHLRIPRSLLASFSSIEEGGAYLVDNGQICVLWIHSLVSQNLLVDLFGGDYTELKSLDPHLSSLPVLQTQLNAQVRNILQYLATLRGSKGLTIQLARQGLDGAEHEFARLLVEDRNNEAQSYVDWLVHVHRHIQLELSGQRRNDDSSETSGTTSLAGLAGMRPPYW